MRTLFIVIISVIASIAATGLYFKNQNGVTPATETAYDRVIRTGVIRCSYGVVEPWIYVDPNTKEMRGLSVEVMEAIGKALNLKIEWTEETDWVSLIPSLNNGRGDVGCSGLWVFAAKSREILYSKPFVYNAIHAYTRASETILKTKSDLNQPSTRFVVMDGELSDKAVMDQFPNATSVKLAPTTPISDFYVYVVTNKADIVASDPFAIATYNSKNEKKLERILLPDPIVSVGAAFPVGKNEFMLRDMIDSALDEIIGNGTLKTIVTKYIKDAPDSLYLPATPYQNIR